MFTVIEYITLLKREYLNKYSKTQDEICIKTFTNPFCTIVNPFIMVY